MIVGLITLIMLIGRTYLELAVINSRENHLRAVKILGAAVENLTIERCQPGDITMSNQEKEDFLYLCKYISKANLRGESGERYLPLEKERLRTQKSVYPSGKSPESYYQTIINLQQEVTDELSTIEEATLRRDRVTRFTGATSLLTLAAIAGFGVALKCARAVLQFRTSSPSSQLPPGPNRPRPSLMRGKAQKAILRQKATLAARRAVTYARRSRRAD